MRAEPPADPTARRQGDTVLVPQALACAGARLVALTHAPPHGRPHARLVILPPWGEEENRSRTMLAALARRLAAGGIAATLLNLSGTGESWPASPPCAPRQWAEELTAAARHLEGPSRPQHPLALLACRQMAVWCAAHVLPALPSHTYAPVLLWDPLGRTHRRRSDGTPAAMPPIWARTTSWEDRRGLVVLRSPRVGSRIWTGREGRIDHRLLDWACEAIGAHLPTERSGQARKEKTDRQERQP